MLLSDFYILMNILTLCEVNLLKLAQAKLSHVLRRNTQGTWMNIWIDSIVLPGDDMRNVSKCVEVVAAMWITIYILVLVVG